MIKCNLRLGNLEFRTCDDSLLTTRTLTTGQVIIWDGDTCCTIAYWKLADSTYNLQFVGDRPFKVDTSVWELFKYGQDYLTTALNLEDQEL